MSHKRNLFRKKPSPWLILWDALPYIVFYAMIGLAFIIAISVCIYCQAPISHGHTVGLV